MRITFVTPFASLSGGLRVVAIYARILQARGYTVTVVSPPFPPPPRGPRALLRRLRHGRLPRIPQVDLSFLGTGHRLLEAHRKVVARDVPDGDVVVATWWETAEWVAALPASKGRKAYLLQDYEVFPPLDPARTITTYRMGLRMIAVSNYIRDVIARQHGIEGIAVVPNGVDHAQFDAGSPDRGRGDPFRAGFLYSKAERKNARLAIEALEAARRRLPGLQAVAFGTRTPTGAQALPEWIAFEENPDPARIATLYASCDAWLFTSHHEGFGLPILEAMASGTPVLATRAGAAPDLIDGRNGRLLEGEPEAFAAAMADLAAMPEARWRAASDAARATARAHDWETAADRLLAHLADPDPDPDPD